MKGLSRDKFAIGASEPKRRFRKWGGGTAVSNSFIGPARDFAMPWTGLMKIEPLARAADGLRTAIFRIRPEVSAGGSQKSQVSSPHSRIPARTWRGSWHFLRIALLFSLVSLAAIPIAAQSTDANVQLYFFTNNGCAPCRQIEPSIESLKREGYNVTTVYLDRNPEWGTTFSVDRTPTVVMLAENRIVGRHAGLIDAATLKQWFAAVGSGPASSPGPDDAVGGAQVRGVASTTSQSNPQRNPSTPIGVNDKVELATYAELPAANLPSRTPQWNLDPNKTKTGTTTHTGTTEPSTPDESRAMRATVRLRVQDAQGISYATGTVIHCVEGEWLVMTCGHAFREAGFNGKITAEYGFLEGKIRSAPGELVSYNSDARDVALVAVRAGQAIEPVLLATKDYSVGRGEGVFSIGCDSGDNPTIRHSKIKNQAIYDGAVKYDIVGRPAIGRSGGGLFNQSGELIGVCNAAAVDTDEGIYSAIDSLHWQLAQSNLKELFEDSTISATGTPADSPQSHPTPPALFASSASGNDRVGVADDSNRADQRPLRQIEKPARQTPVGFSGADQNEGSEQEVIIIVRSKNDNRLGQSITIDNPTPELLSYLMEMQSESEKRQLEMARIRHESTGLR